MAVNINAVLKEKQKIKKDEDSVDGIVVGRKKSGIHGQFFFLRACFVGDCKYTWIAISFQ